MNVAYLTDWTIPPSPLSLQNELRHKKLRDFRKRVKKENVILISFIPILLKIGTKYVLVHSKEKKCLKKIVGKSSKSYSFKISRLKKKWNTFSTISHLFGFWTLLEGRRKGGGEEICMPLSRTRLLFYLWLLIRTSF